MIDEEEPQPDQVVLVVSDSKNEERSTQRQRQTIL